MKTKNKSSNKISNLTGAWKITDSEAKKLLKDIKKGWVNWKVV